MNEPMSLRDCRISVRRRTARWNDDDVRTAWTLGTTLQVTEEQWPTTRAEFDDFWIAACGRVRIDDTVARYLRNLLNLKMVNPLLGLPFRPLLKFLTAGFLAPAFREALGLTWGARRQWLFETLFLCVAFVNRFLPAFIRQGGSHVLLADVRRRVRAERQLI